MSPEYQWRVSQWNLTGGRILSKAQSACQSKSLSSAFCQRTEKYRQEQVDLLWRDISQRHFLRSKDDVKRELTQCFKDVCGKCYEGLDSYWFPTSYRVVFNLLSSAGNMWDAKLEHCSNFLHWVPLGFGVTENTGAFYVSGNEGARSQACTAPGFNCIEHTEIYSVLG